MSEIDIEQLEKEIGAVFRDIHGAALACAKMYGAGDDALDIAGDVSLMIHEKCFVDPVRAVEELAKRKELFALVPIMTYRRMVRQYLRAKARDERNAAYLAELEASTPEWSQPDVAFQAQVIGVALEAAVDRLPNRVREAFHLVRRQRLSHGEAAERMGITENSLSNLISTAHRRLVAELLDD